MFKRALLICLLASALVGQTARADEDKEEPPSLELLEFMADWSVDDQWLDPLELEKMNLPDEEHGIDDTQN